MRIFLRIIAGLILLSVLGTLIFALSMASRGALLGMLRSGPLGITTGIFWLIEIVVGFPAAVLLWRRTNAGRLLSSFFWGCLSIYYILGLIVFRTPETHLGHLLYSLTVGLVLTGILLSGQARLACEPERVVVS